MMRLITLKYNSLILSSLNKTLLVTDSINMNQVLLIKLVIYKISLRNICSIYNSSQGLWSISRTAGYVQGTTMKNKQYSHKNWGIILQ